MNPVPCGLLSDERADGGARPGTLVGLALGQLVIDPALALAEYGDSAGSAAALLGAVQFGVGALVSPLVGLVGNDAVAMGAAIVAALVLAVAVLLVVVVVRPWQLPERDDGTVLAVAH